MQHIDVAVGVLFDHAKQKVLIAKRPEGKFMPGLWEFPGGKLEPGETAEAALARELLEEIGVECTTCTPLLTVENDYPEQDRRIKLIVYCIDAFTGEPEGCEGQEIKWCAIDALGQYEFPAANHPITKKLSLDLLS